MSRPIRRPSSRRVGPISLRNWLSIRVELVEGRGVRYWPRPGRLFAAANRLSTSHIVEIFGNRPNASATLRAMALFDSGISVTG
jgi:hypothetical protein